MKYEKTFELEYYFKAVIKYQLTQFIRSYLVYIRTGVCLLFKFKTSKR